MSHKNKSTINKISTTHFTNIRGIQNVHTITLKDTVNFIATVSLHNLLLGYNYYRQHCAQRSQCLSYSILRFLQGQSLHQWGARTLVCVCMCVCVCKLGKK